MMQAPATGLGPAVDDAEGSSRIAKRARTAAQEATPVPQASHVANGGAAECAPVQAAAPPRVLVSESGQELGPWAWRQRGHRRGGFWAGRH